MNMDLLDIDLTRPTEAFCKTTFLVSTAHVLEWLAGSHLPAIVIECAQLLAYLGASVAFWKMLYQLVKKRKAKNDGQ